MQILTSSSAAAVAAPNRQEVMLCSLVILRKGGAEFLVSGQAPDYRLPTIEIPARQRIAPNLLPRIEESLGLHTVGRFLLGTDQRDLDKGCVVLDVIDPCAPDPAGHSWLSVSAIRWNDFAPEASDVLWSALGRVSAYATGKRAGRFVEAGWFEEVRAWTEKTLTEYGLRLHGLRSQYNLGPDFALLRFATSGSTVWFKAVGSRNAREFAITWTLSDAGAPHTPRVLAFREDWRAWLCLEAEGKHPDSQTAETDWEVAARCLGELQIASIPHTDALLAAGARDLRADHLYQAIDSCLSRLGALMKVQPAVPPHRLDAEAFETIEIQLRQACHRLGALGIPDTVGHSDLSAGNILISETDAVFLDLAESHVGLPFLTLAYLELLAGTALCRKRAREAYLALWRPECSATQIEALLDMTPLLAVFAYVLVCDDPGQHPEELSPELARYLRSLARRMHTEAQALAAPASQ
jgi:hypothetical protein